MSQSHTQKDAGGYRLDPASGWGGAWKIAAVVAGVGIAGSVFAAVNDHERFAFSYLFAYIAFLTIAVGGVFFGLIQYLTSSGWSVSVRRVTEFLHAPMWLFVVLFVPVALHLDQLYPWVGHGGHGEHGAEPR